MPDGAADPVFNPGANDQVFSMAEEADRRILAAGRFQSIGGVFHGQFARLDPDGVVDSTFTARSDNTLYSVAVQPDGKIILCGDFQSISGVPRRGLA